MFARQRPRWFLRGASPLRQRLTSSRGDPSEADPRCFPRPDAKPQAGSLEPDVEQRAKLDAVTSDARLAVNTVEETHSRHGHRARRPSGTVASKTWAARLHS